VRLSPVIVDFGLVAGTLLGWPLYGKVDEVLFRKVVLTALDSGLAIIATAVGRFFDYTVSKAVASEQSGY
jgi:hypothetical protein